LDWGEAPPNAPPWHTAVKNFERLVDLIYEAATDPDLWPALLSGIGRTVGAMGGMLITRPHDQWQWIGYQISPSLASGFDELMRSDTARRTAATTRLLAANRCGFVPDYELFTEEEYAVDPLITEWAMPNHAYHGAATAIQVPNGDLALIQIMRRAGEPGFNRKEVACLDAFRPHLARSALLAVRWRLERLRAAAEALALIGLPAAVLNLGGRVLAANALIEALTSHIVWRPKDQVAFVDPAATSLLQRALVDIRAPAATSVRSFPARGKAGSEPLVAHLIPASSHARDLFGGGFGVLVATPVSAPAPPDTALIQGLFDLTPAEARVACGIVQGLTVNEMALRYSVARETVRTQLKAVLAKTGTRRQAEAAAKLAVLPAIALKRS
jgi:DNA-binding CsgD family transcriptional regulator